VYVLATYALESQDSSPRRLRCAHQPSHTHRPDNVINLTPAVCIPQSMLLTYEPRPRCQEPPSFKLNRSSKVDSKRYSGCGLSDDFPSPMTPRDASNATLLRQACPNALRSAQVLVCFTAFKSSHTIPQASCWPPFDLKSIVVQPNHAGVVESLACEGARLGEGGFAPSAFALIAGSVRSLAILLCFGGASWPSFRMSRYALAFFSALSR